MGGSLKGGFQKFRATSTSSSNRVAVAISRFDTYVIYNHERSRKEQINSQVKFILLGSTCIQPLFILLHVTEFKHSRTIFLGLKHTVFKFLEQLWMSSEITAFPVNGRETLTQQLGIYALIRISG